MKEPVPVPAPPDSVELVKGCREANGTYYVLQSRVTCKCDKQGCEGCEKYYYWERLRYKRQDCSVCHASMSVEPRYHSWTTNDPKDNMVGIYEDAAWLPTCTSCGTRGYYQLGIAITPREDR